jgi:hypothetical protein
VVCLLGIGKVWPTLNNKTTTKIPHESFKKIFYPSSWTSFKNNFNTNLNYCQIHIFIKIFEYKDIRMF